MTRKMIVFSLSFFLVASLAVFALAYDSLFNLSTTPPAGKSEIIGARLIPQEPRGPELWQEKKISIAEAQGRVGFDIRMPSSLPNGYSLKAVIEDNQGNATYKGKEFTVETVNLLFWDRDLPSRVTYSEFSEAGGVWLQIMYSLGENTTKPYESPGYAKPGEVMYLWGYPAVVRAGHVQVFQFEEHLVYRLSGNYSQEALLRMMESLIKG